MRRRLLPVAVACVALAASGCGSGSGDDEPAKPAADPGISSVTRQAIAILEPALGAQYVGRPRGGRLTRRIALSGTAAPRRRLRVDAGCGSPRCRALVTSEADGAWAAQVGVLTPTDRRVVTVEVAYADGRSRLDAPASVAVKLLPRAPEEVGPGEEPEPEAEGPAPASADEPEATTPSPTTGPAPPDAPSAPAGLPSGVLVVGDSLAVGMSAPLRAMGSRVRVDARIGRPLAEGMRILAGDDSPVVAVSLFTNDDPRGVGRLEAAVRQSLRGRRCVVWATIVRPPLGGVSYAAANRALRGMAGGRLRIADWASAVAADRSLLARDGVHATPAGYRARAQLYARELAACS